MNVLKATELYTLKMLKMVNFCYVQLAPEQCGFVLCVSMRYLLSRV